MTHTTSNAFISEALWNRFEAVYDQRGSEEHRIAFPTLVELIEDCGVSDNDSPSTIVDNFLINSEFVGKEDDYRDEVDEDD
jgi:hypothetical protein